MPKLTVNGQTVTVGDEFMQLSPDQQNSTVDEIAKSLPKQETEPKSSAVGDFFKSIPTGIAGVAANYARGEQIESEQRAMAFTDKPNAGPEVPTGPAATKAFGLHQPEGLAGNIGEGVGAAAVNPLTYLGPGGVATKALMAGGSVAGAATGKSVAEAAHAGPGWEAALEFLGGTIGGAGAPGSVRTVGKLASHATAPEATAAAELSRALERDGDTPQSITQRLQAARNVRPEATLADVGKENVRGLTERLAQTSGAGRAIVKPALTKQQQGQLSRISSDLGSSLGDPKRAVQATEETIAQRAKDAGPAYRQLYADGDRAIESEELLHLSGSPTIQGAMESAIKAWRDNAINDGYGAANPGMIINRVNPIERPLASSPLKAETAPHLAPGGMAAAKLEGEAANAPAQTSGNLGYETGSTGGILKMLHGKVPVFPNIQFWNYVKRAMDNEVSKTIPGSDQRRVYTGLTAQLRAALDKEVPAYKQTRDIWAGPSAYLNAIEEGRSILGKGDPDEMRALFNSMSESEKEGYRVGALAAIRGTMMSDPAKAADMTKYLRSPAMREKIAAIMPTPEDAEVWHQRLNHEISTSELTGQALGGPATARRLSQKEDADNLYADLVQNAFSRGPKSAIWQAVMSGAEKVRSAYRGKTDTALAKRLVLPESMDATQAAFDVPPPRVPPGSSGYAALYAGSNATQSLAPTSPLAQPGN